MRKYWKRFLLKFDRLLSSNRVWKPVLLVLALCLVGTLVMWAAGNVWKASTGHCSCYSDNSRLDEVISLGIGQSNYPIESGMPHWYQLLVAMVGTMFFTAFLISMFSNILMNRAASHRKGFIHYYFENHILILGGSRMVLGLLKAIAADAALRKKDVVILTSHDAEALWVDLVPRLEAEEKKRLSLTL